MFWNWPGLSVVRLVARDSNTTYRPSPEIDGLPLGPLASAPVELTLTRVVTPVRRSRTKTSGTPLLSPRTRFGAVDAKATNRPSAEIDGRPLVPAAGVPSTVTLTSDVSAVAANATPPGTSAATASTVAMRLILTPLLGSLPRQHAQRDPDPASGHSLRNPLPRTFGRTPAGQAVDDEPDDPRIRRQLLVRHPRTRADLLQRHVGRPRQPGRVRRRHRLV